MTAHRTATGRYLDIDALKIQQESTIAVGNARQNARGDIIGPGGKVVRTRDEIARDHFMAQQGTKLTNNPVYDTLEQANQAGVVADIFADPPQEVAQALEDVVATPQSDTVNGGGYANALERAKELQEKLKAQRTRI